MRDFLINVRRIWRGNFPDVPRLGRSDDVDQVKGIDKDLEEVLSMDGLSSGYAVRNVMGRHYLEHLWVFLSAETFIEAWTMPDPEPPPQEEPPEEPDLTDIPKTARAGVLAAHRKALEAFNRRQKQAAAAFQAALARKRNLIIGKRDSANAWWTTQDGLTTAVLKTLGVPWRPRLSHAVFGPPVTSLRGKLVQADQNVTLSPNYIEQLLAARDLEKEVKTRNLSNEQPAPHTLLHLLLRHSMLLEYTNAASRYLINHKLQPTTIRREPELVDLPQGQFIQTVWRQLLTKIKVDGQADTIELAKFLLPPGGDPDVAKEPDLTQIKEFRASLDHLKSLSVDKLEHLMSGTLDLCSHRLDAWITSFATKRLADLRKATPTGVLYRRLWLGDESEPAEAQTKVNVPGESEPAIQLAEQSGFYSCAIADASLYGCDLAQRAPGHAGG